MATYIKISEYCRRRYGADGTPPSSQTIRRWIADGRLPAIRDGRQWFVDWDAVQNWCRRAGMRQGVLQLFCKSFANFFLA